MNDLYSYFQTVDADSTFWCKRDGQLDRFLNDEDKVWTNGAWSAPNLSNPVIRDLFNRGINTNDVSLTVEHQGFANQEITEAQYESTSDLVAYWCRTYNIPCDRNHIVGHYEVGEHKQCPGKAVSINRIVEMAKLKLAPPAPATDVTLEYSDPNVWHCLATDKWVVDEHGFLTEWRKYGLKVYGYPISGARVQANSNDNIIEQWFERARFEYRRDTKQFLLGRLGAELFKN
jgi:hypothetical protein